MVIIMLQQFCPESGHIDIRRALALTAFASQAGVKHFLDHLVITPSCQDLSDDVASGSCRLDFVSTHLIGRTHRTAYQITLPAIASPVALFDGTHQGMRLTLGPGGAWSLALIECRLPIIVGMV